MPNLPQNFSFNGSIDYNVLRDFWGYMESRKINAKNDLALQRAWGEFTNLVQGNDQFSRSVLVGPYSSDNKIYPTGPFSWQHNDFISDVVPDGNAISAWISTDGTVETHYETVGHLEWVAPAGWGGSNFSSFLANQEIGECEFGSGTKYAAYTYQISYGTFSKSTDTFKIIPNVLVNREYKNSPTYHMFKRGNNAGLPLENDIDFQLARMALDAKNHYEWNLIYGDLSNSNQEWDGLDVMLDTGYVAAHPISGFSNVYQFVDPIVVDGSVLATVQAVIQEMRHMVREMRRRASIRKLGIMAGDHSFFMSSAHWQAIAEVLAVEGLIVGNTYNSTDVVERRLAELMGDGTVGQFPVDGRPVPVFCVDELATNTNSNTTATGTIFLLMRSIGGENILVQQPIDFTNVQKLFTTPVAGVSINVGLGGLARYGSVAENSTCWYYFCEMGGRLVSRYQPFQGRINSVTVPLHGVYRTEASTYTDNFYGNVNNVAGTLGAGL